MSKKKTMMVEGKLYELVPIETKAAELKSVHGGYHPVTGKALLVADRDFPEPMTWDEGNLIIEESAPGWRRPTIEELHVLYAKKDIIGGFIDKRSSGYAHWYWSCTEHRGVPSFVHHVDFTVGQVDWGRKDNFSLSSRLVRAELPA